MTDMRAECLRRIEAEVAAKRQALEAELEAEKGLVSQRDVLLLDAICDVDRVRREAAAAVAENGLRERYSNGRQVLERENRAVGQMCKASATLGKLIAALGVKPRGVHADDAPPEEEDGVDELDDY